MAEQHGMIEPFEPGQVRQADGQKIISYGWLSASASAATAAVIKASRRITLDQTWGTSKRSIGDS